MKQSPIWKQDHITQEKVSKINHVSLKFCLFTTNLQLQIRWEGNVMLPNIFYLHTEEMLLINLFGKYLARWYWTYQYNVHWPCVSVVFRQNIQSCNTIRATALLNCFGLCLGTQHLVEVRERSSSGLNTERICSDWSHDKTQRDYTHLIETTIFHWP